MKKISLKTVKSSMKRDEMRSIKGGSGNCTQRTLGCYYQGSKLWFNTTAYYACCF